MTASENTNIQDVLQLLNNLDASTSFEVYIPSLKKNLKFKQLNAEQLKRLLKTIIDSPVYNSQFITTFNSIIKENCIESHDTSTLTILDKLLILIKTRIECVSPTYNFIFSPTEIAENKLKDKSYTIDLTEQYNSFVTKGIDIELKTYDEKNYTITCGLPTLATENKLEKEFHKNVKLEITTPEELRNTLGETFINEITKYIRSLEIDNTEIHLDQLDFKTRVKIVEKLPTNGINKVLKFVEEYKKVITPLISYSIPTENNFEYIKDIPQDASFFNI
jgi:hypothetical protein